MTIAVKKVALHLYVFLFIFNPTNFVDFNFIYVLGFVGIIFILKKYKTYIKFLSKKSIFIYISFSVYLISYLLLMSFLGGDDALYEAYNFSLVLVSFLISAFIVISYLRIYPLSFNGFLRFLINIGVIQLFFVFLSLLVPEFRDWALETSRSENLTSISNDYGGLRSYGLANGYTSTFPMLMGIIALILLALVINKPSFRFSMTRDFTLALLFIISVILNARTGLLPVLIFLLSTLSFLVFDFKRVVAIFYISVSLTFLVVLLSITSFIDYDKYIVRLVWGYEELANLFGGKATGTFEVLASMLHFPDNYFEFFWGTGHNVFGEQARFQETSDIGFVRDIYLFGFINLTLLLITLSIFFKPLLVLLKEKFGFIFVFSFIVSIFLFYVKGAAWAATEIYNFIILIGLFSIYYKSKQVSYRKNLLLDNKNQLFTKRVEE